MSVCLSVAAEYTGTTYEVKINRLHEILPAWENGKNIAISTTLVNVNAPVVATTSWWLHFTAPVVA